MIRSFRHKGLRALFEEDNTRGVQQNQVKRLRALLTRLSASHHAADMDIPGLRLHPLKGKLAGFYAVDVSGNWRLLFRFDTHGDVVDVDLMDYH